MSLRFPNNGTQSRVEHDVGTDDDLVGRVSVLAWSYFDTNSANVHYLWKNAHARGFGRVGAQLYFKMNGSTGLHEAQTDNALATNAWNCVAFSYDFSTSALGIYAATLGSNLAAVNIWYNSNSRVGMETNVGEPQICGSRQGFYNYDRNWDNPVSVLAVWWETLTLQEFRDQQYKLWAAVNTPKLHFMSRYGLGAVTDPQPDLGPNGYAGTPFNAVAGPLMPTALFELFPTIAGAAALSAAGSLAAAGVMTVPGQAALAAAGGLAAAGRVTVAETAVLAAAGSLTAAGLVTVAEMVVLAGSGTLVVVGRVAVRGQAAASGTGSLTAAGRIAVTETAVLTAAATLAAAGAVTVTAAAVLSSGGAISAAGLVRVIGQAQLAGAGSLAAAGSIVGITRGTAVLAATANLAAAGSITVAGATALSAAGALTAAGVGASVVGGAAALSAAGSLAAAGRARVSAAAALSAAGGLAALWAATVAGTAALSAAGSLTAVRLPLAAVVTPPGRTLSVFPAGRVVTTAAAPRTVEV